MNKTELEGILLIDKPKGITSHDVVNRVRHKLQMKRIGHAGTLDPNATGLIIILVGKATKVSQFLMSVDKSYDGVMKLGEVTNSYDCDGEIVETHPVGKYSHEELASVFAEFKGDQYQTPPMHSAIKVNGVPLYKLARKGNEIERKQRFIRISKLDILSCDLPLLNFSVDCTKGTYIRSLVHDIGRKLGCGAYLAELRRTACDHFSVDKACTLDELQEMNVKQIRSTLIPIYQAVPSHIL